MDSITAISAGTRSAQQGLLFQSLYADAGGPVRSAARFGEPRLEFRRTGQELDLERNLGDQIRLRNHQFTDIRSDRCTPCQRPLGPLIARHRTESWSNVSVVEAERTAPEA